MIDRRSLLTAAAATAAASSAAAAADESLPIIDSHFHLYDQTRPQGSPYPFQPNQPPFLPKHFRESAIPLGVVAGIEVECSPWVEDNLWVLSVIQDEPMIVGTVGNLDPLDAKFKEYLERYHRNKLFLGIRYGNIWPGHDIVSAVDKPAFIENMKVFAQTGLTFEVANPRLDLVAATLKLAEKVPDLRIVLGHLQALALPTDAATLRSYTNNLKELHARKAFVKVSGLHRPRNAQAFDEKDWKPVMDLIWDTFGEDWLVYSGRNKQAIEILKRYFLAKGRPAAEKYFWKNSLLAFKWVKRAPNQPQLS